MSFTKIKHGIVPISKEEAFDLFSKGFLISDNQFNGEVGGSEEIIRLKFEWLIKGFLTSVKIWNAEGSKSYSNKPISLKKIKSDKDHREFFEEAWKKYSEKFKL